MIRQNETGFTLIEVLVSMAIFAFGILAVINMQLVASKTTLKARYMTEGVVLAQSKIEELMAQDYGDSQLDVGGGDLDAGWAFIPSATDIEDEIDGVTDHQVGSFHPIYKIGWNVVADTPFPDTKTVRVIVKWYDQSTKKRFALDMVKSRGD